MWFQAYDFRQQVFDFDFYDPDDPDSTISTKGLKCPSEDASVPWWLALANTNVRFPSAFYSESILMPL